MKIAFKYKLTLLILAIILLLLSGTFYMVQTNLENKFIQNIKNDLQETRLIIKQMMTQRFRSIATSANILKGNTLIREILLDHTMDRVTAEDIIKEEVLPDFRNLSIMLVIGNSGKILATQGVSEGDTKNIKTSSLFQRLLKGRRGMSYLFQDETSIQMLSVPIFIREELIGALIIGSPFTQKLVNSIQSMSGADLALFKDEHIFLSSLFLSSQSKNKKSKDTAILGHIESVMNLNKRKHAKYADQKNPPAPEMFEFNQERWLYSLVHDRKGFVPDYVLAKSLDGQLAFVDDIRQDTLYIAFAALMIGLLMSFVFSLGVSRPIVALKRATDAVEQEDFTYRTQINSHDEFEQLGSAFNLMIEGLEERESMRGSMNRLMSKPVVDHLLEDRIKTDGEFRQVTCLSLYLDNMLEVIDSMEPKTGLALLNDCFTRVGFCLDAEQGLVNRYSNSSLIAMFGVPVANDKQILNGYQCALAIVDALDIFNAEYTPTITIVPRITLFSGEMLVGNVGAEQRESYNLVGDLLNQLNEIQKQLIQKKGTIAVNSTVYETLPSDKKTDLKAISTYWVKQA